MRAYLFGTGWWTLWHLFLWGLLLCVAGLTWWLWIVKPGKGPQGGEFAAMLLLMFLLGWTLASFVHAMVLAQGMAGGGGRYVKAGGLWLLGWGVYCWLVYKLTNHAASDAGLFTRRASLAGFLVLVAALYGVSLEVLSRRRPG